jgi:hypothetical protein
MKSLRVFFAVSMFTIFAASANANICSTFDADLDGWTSNSPTELIWASSGITPGGYVHFDDGIGDGSFIWAPSKFLGDWSHLAGSIIIFNHRLTTVGGGTTQPYEIRIFGDDGSSAEWSGNRPGGATDWVLVTVPLDESEWVVTGSWCNLLASVAELWIRIEMVEDSGNDAADLDNVCLVEVISPCAGTATNSTIGKSPVYGASDLGTYLAFSLLPLGTMIGLMIWRRKR